MIGAMPSSLSVGGKQIPIRADYRIVLTIMEALNDNEITELDKLRVMIELLYKENIKSEHIQEAIDKAVWFLNCGKDKNDEDYKPNLYDWEQDEQMIFSAINKVAGKEIRELDYMHWWTFIGLFNEIGECTFATVCNIRDKKARGKQLEKWELEYYYNNKKIIDFQKDVNKEQMAEVNNLLGI